MPGRNIFDIQSYSVRHNHQIVCHQLLYVQVIFIYSSKDERKNVNQQIFFTAAMPQHVRQHFTYSLLSAMQPLPVF